jgi:outer membrane lipoprotein-sorting protein
MSRLLLILVPALLAASDPKVINADALLRRADDFRNGGDSYTVRMKITNFQGARRVDEHLYQVSQKGAEKTHVEFLSPREKGQFLLMLGDNMWVYLPSASRPVRITPLERLTGNASNGDVARSHFAEDYAATYLRDETVKGQPCHVLSLAAKRKGATYRRIEYWIRVRDSRPEKADFFLASGKHIKSATYDRYEINSGSPVLVKMSIYDQVKKEAVSVIEYSNFKMQDLPDKLFHQSSISR